MPKAETAVRPAPLEQSRPSPARVFVVLWPWFAAALSGALLVACFPPWNVAWLCWVALTPLISAIWFAPRGAQRPWRRQTLLGYVAGFVFFAGAFYWLSSLGPLFSQPWLNTLPLLLALYMGLYFAFWAWFIGALVEPSSTSFHSAADRSRTATFGRLTPFGIRGFAEPATAPDPRAKPFLSSRGNLLTAALAAAAWVSHEWIRGWLFSGFGWNGLGVALHADLRMIQIADITGVAGLSFLVAFCNVMIVLVIRRIAAELGPVFLKRIRWEFSLTIALVVLVFGYGVRQLMTMRPEAHARTLRVAAVQPNIPQNEKFSPESEDKVLQRLEGLTSLAAATQPDLLLWPEAATPRGMFADELNHAFVLRQAQRGDFAMLLGTLDADLEKRAEFNVATLLTEQGQRAQTYRKMHLVPFGEYLPLRESFPLFAMIAGELVPMDFSRGREFTVMQIAAPPVKLSALICFEDTLGDLTRRFVLNGAELLVNLTNDGWFLRTAAAEQHLANAVFRAVENRRPLVRCANTGVTAAIDIRGAVQRWVPLFEQGFATRPVTVSAARTFTFYTRHGEWFTYGCVAVTAVALVSRLWRKRIRAR